MKYDCEIIKDLIPLCQDDTASAKSKRIVSEHLKECEKCCQYDKSLKESQILPIEISRNNDDEYAESFCYAKLAKKIRIRKYAIAASVSLFLIISLYCAISYAVGNRFDSYEAAQVSDWIDENSILLGNVGSESYHVYLYENDDKYRTIVTHYSFPFWKETSSSWANKTDDKIKLVGWCSIRDSENGITLVPIQCFDEDVAYIEMGTGEDLIRKEISTNETVIFLWEKSIRWNDLNAVAYSKDDQPLYHLGYEIKNGTTIYSDELRWLAVEK